MNISLYMQNVVRLIALLGAIQGIILFLLLFQRRKNKSNFYMAFFLLSFSIYLIPYADPSVSLYLRYPYLLVLVDFIPFFHTPLLYFYFYHTLYKNSRPRYPLIIHQIPAIADFILINGWYFIIGENQFREILRQAFFVAPPVAIQIGNYFKYASGVFYGVLIINLIYTFAQNSNVWLKNKRLRIWLITFISTYIFCWAIIIATGVVISSNKMDQDVVKYFVFFQLLSLTGTMYLIAYFAFRNPTLFPEEMARKKIAQKLNIDDETTRNLQKQLEQLMKHELPYLDENASLQSIAQSLKIHPNALSYLVNEKYGKNFAEYINDHRLDYFMDLTKRETETTILRLALDSGFASKTTFNRAFKKRFKMTPGEYLGILPRTQEGALLSGNIQNQ